jgi:hypothetical protein
MPAIFLLALVNGLFPVVAIALSLLLYHAFPILSKQNGGYPPSVVESLKLRPNFGKTGASFY